MLYSLSLAEVSEKFVFEWSGGINGVLGHFWSTKKFWSKKYFWSEINVRPKLFWIQSNCMSQTSALLCLEHFEKFVVVVGWWARPVLGFSFNQAKQQDSSWVLCFEILFFLAKISVFLKIWYKFVWLGGGGVGGVPLKPKPSWAISRCLVDSLLLSFCGGLFLFFLL